MLTLAHISESVAPHEHMWQQHPDLKKIIILINWAKRASDDAGTLTCISFPAGVASVLTSNDVTWKPSTV